MSIYFEISIWIRFMNKTIFFIINISELTNIHDWERHRRKRAKNEKSGSLGIVIAIDDGANRMVAVAIRSDKFQCK